MSGREWHPVTHVAYEDAEAYAHWAGKGPPTEAEWEFAARGGLDGAAYAWGDEFAPGGELLANTWQGEFPWQNLLLEGYAGTSPVRAFAQNGYGLFDVTGNVWEWTVDVYSAHHAIAGRRPCCQPAGDRAAPAFPRRVIKGGSHLCAPSYCRRYRPAARQGQSVETRRRTSDSVASGATPTRAEAGNPTHDRRLRCRRQFRRPIGWRDAVR